MTGEMGSAYLCQTNNSVITPVLFTSIPLSCLTAAPMSRLGSWRTNTLDSKQRFKGYLIRGEKRSNWGDYMIVFFDWKVLQGPSRPSGPLCPLRPHLGSLAPTHPENAQDQDGSFQSLTTRVTITHVIQLISGSILKRFLDYKSLEHPWQSSS